MNTQQMIVRFSLCLLAACPFAVAPTCAQILVTHVPLVTFNGDSANDNFGRSASGAGDVNGDGIADLIVGAVNDDNNGFDSGSAQVLSGFDGSLLHSFDEHSANDQLGVSVSGAGDVNGDGFADLIIGLADGAAFNGNAGPFSGTAQVRSGSDGSLLHSFATDSTVDRFGWAVSGAGDVNGDGLADLIVGARYDDQNGERSGSARVFSGSDGGVLHTFDDSAAGDWFGYSVSGAGDVNGDGFADLIVGAYRDDNNGGDSGSATRGPAKPAGRKASLDQIRQSWYCPRVYLPRGDALRAPPALHHYFNNYSASTPWLR